MKTNLYKEATLYTNACGEKRRVTKVTSRGIVEWYNKETGRKGKCTEKSFAIWMKGYNKF